MAYIGNTPTTQSFISGTDYFNGTGSQTAFTLSRTVASQNDVEAVVNNVVQQPNAGYTISGTTITFTSAPSAGTQNVYVRYLSTTTQAISPSQGTVGWNQLNTDTQQDLGISFKNRIINGAMMIDQRNAGASVTPAVGATYFLDRWFTNVSQSSKLSCQQNAGSVTPPVGFKNYLGVTSLSSYSVISSDFFTFSQLIEGFNTYDLEFGTANAKTITLSFWVRSSLTGTFAGGLRNGDNTRSYPFTYTISAANTWEQKSVTIAGDTTGTWIGATNGIGLKVTFNLGSGSTFSGTANSWQTGNFTNVAGATSVVGTNGATFYITGVQLEVGTQATTFTTAGGSYGAELALCQRYYYRAVSGVSLGRFGSSYNSTTNTAIGIVNFPSSMRISPTALEQSGTAGDYAVIHSVATTCTGVPILNSNGTNTLCGMVAFSTTTGLTAGQGSQIASASGVTTAYLGFSAEL